MAKVVGIDIGSQKLMLVCDDGEIIRTDTGSVSWPNLIAFHGRNRLVGEEALPQATGDNTISMINAFVGKSMNEITSMPVSRHFRCKISEDESGLGAFEVSYFDEVQKFDSTSLLAMIVSKVDERIKETCSNDIKFSFAIPPNSPESTKRSIMEACEISGVAASRVAIVDAADCLVKTYGRKVAGLRESEKLGVEVRKISIDTFVHIINEVVFMGTCHAGKENSHHRHGSHSNDNSRSVSESHGTHSSFSHQRPNPRILLLRQQIVRPFL